MPATIVARSETTFTVQVEIPYGSSMLDCEQTLQQRLNEAGTLATAELLQRFDTDGSPIQVGDTKLTSKCERRSENVARGGDRRAVRKRSAHGFAHGSEVTMGDFFSHPDP